jgi:hypothetical protein
MSVHPKPATELWPLEQFKTDPRELARHDDPEKIRLHGEDMRARGQLQAVGATEDGRMIFGHGRWLAAKAVGIKTLETKVFPATLTDTQFRLIRAAENLQRKELTGFERWILCSELMGGNPTWALKDLAQNMSIDQSMVTRLLSPSRCTEQWQQALKEGKVGISDCYVASKLVPEEQAGLLALKLSGASRDQIEQAARKTRNGNGQPAQKATRMKCAVPGRKLVIQFNAQEPFSLDMVIDATQELIKEMRKSAERGLDPQTFARVCKDLSKKA